jgi:phosphatidylglycerophosphatase A
MKNYLTKLTATFFGIGFLPVAPGTFGSLAGATIYYLLWRHEIVFYAALFLLIIIGFSVSGRAEVLFGKKDPKCVVIDEVAGVMIAFILVPFTWFNIAMVFLLFRFMDIVKPYPIRKLERMPGSAGIMLDDILAGIYANLLFQIGLIFASYKLV